jgi:hypothetical protein
MNLADIIRIANQCGWDAEPHFTDKVMSIDFNRKTPSGVPFCFSAEMADGKVDMLIGELISFVEAAEPAVCAEMWMIRSGVVAPHHYRRAVNDMENIRTEAWILACKLAIESMGHLPIRPFANGISN